MSIITPTSPKTFFRKVLKRSLATSMLLAGCLSLCTFEGKAQQRGQDGAPVQTQTGVAPGRLIIKFRERYRPSALTESNGTRTNIPQIDELNARFGCTAVKRLPTGKKNINTSFVYTLEFPLNVNMGELIQAYRESGVLEVVEADQLTGVNTTTPNDPSFNTDWAAYNTGGSFGMTGIAGRDMDMRLAWDITRGSGAITLAIIDAGVKLDHPEFAGRIWANPGEVAGNGIDDDGNGYVDDYRGWDWVNHDNNPTDDNSHGTHVAGIAAATGNNGIGHAGVDWNCKLMVLKTQGASGSGYMSDVISAVYYATDEGARVINMSLGSSGTSTTLQDAFNYAYAHNVVCVAAMGNDNSGSPFYPAACSHVIAVGASTCNDTRAYFSNYGSHISVIAPGYYIYGLSHTSNTDYAVLKSGTSMASPQVAGVVSLMLAIDPTKTPDEIKSILEATAEDQVGSSTEDVAGFDNYYGHGRVNAYQALSYLTSQISGASTVCAGATTTLTTSLTGGTWSSGATSVATVSSSGVVTGVATGTAVITYTYSGGIVSRLITVTGAPTAATISGSSSVCAGSTAALTATTTGGTWSSSTPAVGTISSTGTFAGLSAGTTTISYTLTNTCGATVSTRVNTVNPLPVAGTISGSATVAIGTTVTLTNTVTGGAWSVSNTKASVSAAGVVTGMAAGPVVVSYTKTNSCGTAVATLSMNVSPGTVSGPASVCTGSTITLSWGVTGGTWTSSAPTKASVNASGMVTGVSAGTAVITYTLAGGANTAVITVNSTPATITGTTSVCSASSITLSNTSAGGIWSSSNISNATVGSSSGVVTGVAAGAVNILYTNSEGCSKSAVVTVIATPAAITGTRTVCAGASTTIASTTLGGIWTSNHSLVPVNYLGVVTAGIGTGNDTAIISYTKSGCSARTVVTINAHPFTFSMPVCYGSFCVGTNGGMYSSEPGTWSTSNPTVMSVNAAGVFTALSPGSSYVSVTTAAGCMGGETIPVVAQPSAIGGVLSACTSGTTTLTNTVAGGAWSSSDMTVASVAPTGIATGFSTGTTTITYTNAGHCTVTATLTVNTTPANITGTFSACPGTTATLINSLSGGTWSSSNTATASIGATNGVATGVAAGTTNITYSRLGCRKTAVVSVNPNPVVSGALTVCQGKTTTLTSVPTTATWLSGNTLIATVATGSVTGVAGGTTRITFTTAQGCKAMPVVTVNALPPTIGGTLATCAGSTTSLTNTTTGGTWASSAVTIGTISATGVATGIAAGTSTISYTAPTGCLRTGILTVNALPTITGTVSACVGTTATLMGATTGGTWSSQATGVATVGSTGVVTGVSAGTASIDYVLPTGCKRTTVATVNVTPGVIGGTASVCVGRTTTLTNSVTGGNWTSGAGAIATVGSSTGIVTGMVAGTALISYTKGICRATKIVTVLALPNAFTGTAKACTGTSTTLATTTTGGTWSSSATTIGTVSTTGVVTGIAAGTANIIYTTPNTCSRTVVLTVNASPAAITGASAVCAAATTTLTDATTGLLSWTSSDISKATVSAAGIVTGVNAGTSRITYTISNGCYATKLMTINALPAAITGTFTACPGTTATLSNTVTGGTWSSGTVGVATIGSTSGIISGVAAGTTAITYTSSVGCRKTATATINANPAITGALTVCAGKITTLTSSPLSTSWTSANTVVATVTSGNVTGVSGGTARITFTTAAGCKSMPVVTVNALPPTIGGTLAVCIGSVTSLSNSVTGGTWASSPVTAGTVSSTGVVTGLAAGTTNISYTAPTGCVRTGIVTVNALPTITGSASVCVGTAATLTGAATGGTWSSLGAAVATVGTNGVVTGVAAGTTAVDYTLANGCKRTAVATVNVTPGTISGTPSVCAGSTTALTNTVAGGVWTSSAPTIASVGTTGVVTGINASSTLISYTIGTCRATRAVSVLALPAVIGGVAKACPGTSTTLSNTTAGGVWTSSNPAIGTVGTTGMVTGISAGTTNIVYTTPNTCARSVVMTINTNPASISGASGICVGTTTTLTESTTGGTWSSSDLSKATVNAAGVVTGSTAGTTRISYTLPTGCFAMQFMTVNALPASITGTLTACTGNSITLSNTTTGGVWSTSNPTVATINATTGVVTSNAAGTVVVTYTTPAGCIKTVVATMNQSPAALTGTASLCTGTTTVLTATGAGIWSSLSPSIATVNTAGTVTGVTSGTATIVFAVANGCKANKIVTVNICGPREASLDIAQVKQDGVAFYPNPTSGVFTIAVPTSGTLSILTVDGRPTALYNIVAGDTELSLPANLTPGIYLAHFAGTDGQVYITRIVYQGN